MSEPMNSETLAPVVTRGVGESDAEAIIEAAERWVGLNAEPIEVPGVADMLILRQPSDTQVIRFDAERFAARPRRKSGTVHLTDTASFAEYINKHTADGTVVYADGRVTAAAEHAGEGGGWTARFGMVAVLNDHGTEPGHGDHRAELALQLTPGAQRWLRANGLMMEQQKFAQLVEDGLTEIAQPDGATVLEIAQTLHATTNAAFRSGYQLHNGQLEMQYVQQITQAAGREGQLSVPEKLTLVVEPFYGAQPVEIEARLRVRFDNEKVRLGVHLVRPAETFRAAFAAEMDRLGDLLTESGNEFVPILAGTPR